ncbi:MAG TPA: hypothetical protein VKU80_08210 [Planctomycetota bacterium]|nr:hypothetical protein [Planctomycetota bacterium]
MKPILPFLLALSACGRGAEPEVPPKDSRRPPQPPALAIRLPAAPLESIAFVREDGIWTVASDGSDLRRIVPPTLPRAEDPSWSFDRRWIAFAAAVDPEANLYPRNLFVARPDGTDVRQVTPMPRAGAGEDDGPKGVVRGRAVLVAEESRRPLPQLRVSAYGLRRPESTDSEGHFQTYLPAGGGWIKLSGRVDGKPVLAWRFAAAIEGRVTDLKDVPLGYSLDDQPSSPAWCDQDRQLLYVMRHSAAPRSPGSPQSTLRRIRVDGSGDESVAAFETASVIAGPVVRSGQAWIKMSDGMILRFDLQTKTLAESRPAGLCAPDALAVSPNGTQVATLRMDAQGARSLVILNKDAEVTVLEFKAADAAPRGFDFSPDGTRMVLDLVGPGGRPSLSVLTIATRSLVPLVDNGSAPVWHGR